MPLQLQVTIHVFKPVCDILLPPPHTWQTELLDDVFLSGLLSACEPAPTPSSTPAVQQRGSIHPTGPPPLQRQLQPSTPQLTNNCSPNHTPALSPSHLRNLPQANQSQQFAMPHPPIGSSSVSFNAEQR